MALQGKKEFTLTVREDYEHGITGWVVQELAEMEDQPSVATDGYLLAHDIVEHVNGINEIGGIGEELQALGGFWRTRGQYGDIRRDRSQYNPPCEAIANDFLGLFERFAQGEEIGQEIPELVEHEDYEEDWEDILEHTDKNIRENLSYLDLDLDLDKQEIEDTIEEYKKALAAFFNQGIIKHEGLYPDAMMANSIFYGIVDALEGMLDYPDSWDEIVLTIDYDNWSVEAEKKELEFEEDEDY